MTERKVLPGLPGARPATVVHNLLHRKNVLAHHSSIPCSSKVWETGLHLVSYMSRLQAICKQATAGAP